MTDLAMPRWLEWGLAAVALLALERIFAWMERRGWIYWRGQTNHGPPAATGSRTALLQAFGDDRDRTLAKLVQGHSPYDWPALAAQATCGRALDDLRRGKLSARLPCLFVMELDGRLAGTVSVASLLSAGPEKPVSDVMTTDVVTLMPSATIHAALDALLEQALVVVPVVDAARRMIGVLDIHTVAAECRRATGRSGPMES